MNVFYTMGNLFKLRTQKAAMQSIFEENKKASEHNRNFIFKINWLKYMKFGIM